ncbi:8-amino-7-oxononanoate synthase [Parasalinivibrio latis]|uniref:8-amino-7-oxononanoate synthase n=1 Tax=Parasalinivibrio latis TaxID=2952610 RepID=UPI0030E1C1A1
MGSGFFRRINDALTARKESGLYRYPPTVERVDGHFMDSGGKRYLNFSSNDYLGLAGTPDVCRFWQEGVSRYGAGSTASPLVTGYSSPHADLERMLCDWLGFESAVLFNSGFAANQAVIFTLCDKEDLVIQDKLNHASLMEAGMLSPARMKRFRHNDTESLSAALSCTVTGNRLVVTEGVFSMDGDKSPLSEIATVARHHDAWLMVDDAHGIGVLGEDGSGSCRSAGIKPDILVVTFGKAFGLMGAAVLCQTETADYLRQFGRHYVYSTAMPPAQAYTIRRTAEIIQTQQWRREKLSELSAVWEEALSGIPGATHTNTPIKPVIVGQSEPMLRLSEYLRQKGYWVGAIRPPTVPANKARLRVTLSVSQPKVAVLALAGEIKNMLEGEQCLPS